MGNSDKDWYYDSLFGELREVGRNGWTMTTTTTTKSDFVRDIDAAVSDMKKFHERCILMEVRNLTYVGGFDLALGCDGNEPSKATEGGTRPGPIEPVRMAVDDPTGDDVARDLTNEELAAFRRRHVKRDKY